jgi:hypothetical protein
LATTRSELTRTARSKFAIVDTDSGRLLWEGVRQLALALVPVLLENAWWQPADRITG